MYVPLTQTQIEKAFQEGYMLYSHILCSYFQLTSDNELIVKSVHEKSKWQKYTATFSKLETLEMTITTLHKL
jgi:hypothetical protein